MTNLQSQYGQIFSKNGMAILVFSREMLSKQVSERINTVEHYSNELNVGRGTIQFAVKFLADTGALSLESRGHKGTFITHIDYQKLMDICGLNNITCSMPLPYSKRYEGLATGLYKVFENSGINFNIAYARGAVQRILNLKEKKVDMSVVSKLAANIAISNDNIFEIICEFGDFSYVGERVLIFREKQKSKIENGMKVAIDHSSIDQTQATLEICKGLDVVFVETSYAQITNMLQQNRIDVALWNGDNLENKDFGVVPVKLSCQQGDDKKAVIIALSENNAMKNIVKRYVDKDQIQKIQNSVINNETIPNY